MSETSRPIEISAEVAATTQAREQRIFGFPPRIPPMRNDEYSDDVRRITRELKIAAGLPPVGDPPEFIATALRHDKLYMANLGFAIELMARGALASRDKELAILRTGWICQAPFEWGEHVAMAKRTTDLTSEEIDRVTRGSTAPEWSRHDRAILRAVEELFEDAMITDETWAILAQSLDDKQLIELPMLVGQYAGVAFLQNSLRARMMDGNIGLGAR